MTTIDDNDEPEKDPDETYEEAFRRVDHDALHDAIVNRGTDLLRLGLPRVVVAARWEELSRQRTEARRQEKLRDVTPETLGLVASLDPFEILKRSRRHHRIVTALSSLSDVDVTIVWGNAEGRSDDEIRTLLHERGVDPLPTVELIRKRRQRALEKLRREIAKLPP